MILYHGTSARHRSSIEQNGLMPRSATGVSNWAEPHDGLIESKDYLVYLTTSYPVYYALGAARNDDDLLIVEVDVDEKDLFPDEDFLAYLADQQKMFPGKTLAELNQILEPMDNCHLTMDSLKYHGVAATRFVARDQIKRMITISCRETQLILTIGGDAMPVPMNFRIFGDAYRRSIAALFDEGPEAAILVIRNMWGPVA